MDTLLEHIKTFSLIRKHKNIAREVGEVCCLNYSPFKLKTQECCLKKANAYWFLIAGQ